MKKNILEKKEAQFYGQVNNFPFAKAVRVGGMVYFSGMIGLRNDGQLDTGFEAQAKQTMDNIEAMLQEQGLTMDNVIKCTIMIADMSKWDAFNKVYVTYFKNGRYPTRSAFGASALALEAELEVEVVAYDPQ